MSSKPLNLFNAYDLQPNPYEPSKVDFVAILMYCECRFRAALQSIIRQKKQNQTWMLKTLFLELVG
jgi:hypothetical protein